MAEIRKKIQENAEQIGELASSTQKRRRNYESKPTQLWKGSALTTLTRLFSQIAQKVFKSNGLDSTNIMNGFNRIFF